MFESRPVTAFVDVPAGTAVEEQSPPVGVVYFQYHSAGQLPSFSVAPVAVMVSLPTVRVSSAGATDCDWSDCALQPFAFRTRTLKR